MGSRDNSTNYEHPQENNLLNVHKAMEYNVLGEPVLRTTLGPTASDAFGRFRTSQPFTLYDSFNRFYDVDKLTVYSTGTGSTSTFDANGGTVVSSIGTDSGSAVYRESDKVFAYQPGKSLLILRTFCMNEPKFGLRQRVGYFDINNGVFLQRDGDEISFVIRSSSQGSIQEDKITRDNWNITRLDGTSADKIVLDLSLAQILYINIEWLGVGTVECGFVINSQFIPCHRFYHSNVQGNTTTYMTTACLPIRSEIQNTTSTTSTSSLRIICSTVISEGGYDLNGRPRSVGTEIDGYTMSGNNTRVLYPLVSIRLKAGREGAIVLPKDFSYAVSEANVFRYEILTRAITTGGTWLSFGDDSSVEYNLSATGFVNTGTTVLTGIIASSNQTSAAPQVKDFPFLWQLTRNTLTNPSIRYEFVLAMKHGGNSLKGWAHINWEEIT